MTWLEVLTKLRKRPLKPSGLLVDEKEKLKKRLTEFAKEHRQILGIALFGSRTRGDWNGFSDWDILFVVENADERLMSLVHSFCIDFSEEFSPGGIQPLMEDAEEQAEPILAGVILKDGRLIYART